MYDDLKRGGPNSSYFCFYGVCETILPVQPSGKSTHTGDLAE